MHQLNETVNRFDGAINKGLIVFTTSLGNVGYILESVFPFPNNTQVKYFSFTYGAMELYSKVSPSQQYFAISAKASRTFYIISLSNLSQIYTSTITSNGAYSLTWHSTADVVYISMYSNNALYIVNMTNSYSKVSDTFLRNVYGISFFNESSEVIGFSLDSSMMTMTVFGYTVSSKVLK